MGLFDQFPYTNFHELNLDWILKVLKELDNTIEEFVSLNALKYADPIQWDITRQYEKNTIVIDPLTGTAYLSTQPVPSGVGLSNTDYWTVVFDLSAFIIRAARNFTDHYETEGTTTATFNSNVNDWIVIGDVLYYVATPINIGDQYVTGSNIIHFTIEDIIGHVQSLDTNNKSNLVAAINEVLGWVNTVTGDVNDLDTTDKTNLVAAINEVLYRVGLVFSSLKTLDIYSGHERKIVCIGDSYLAGSGTPYAESDSWGAKIRMLFNNGSDTIIKGWGGTGFIGQDPDHTYIIQLQEVVAALTEDEREEITDILVQGGLNDKYGLNNNTYTVSDIKTAINTFCTYAHTNFPNAMIRIGVAGWATDGLTDKINWGKILNCYKTCAAANAPNRVQYMSGLEYIMPTFYDSEYYDTVHPDVRASEVIARGMINCMMGGDGIMGDNFSNQTLSVTWNIGITQVARDSKFDIYGDTATVYLNTLWWEYDTAITYNFESWVDVATIDGGAPVRASLGIFIPATFWIDDGNGNATALSGQIRIKSGVISYKLTTAQTTMTIKKVLAHCSAYSDSLFNIC